MYDIEKNLIKYCVIFNREQTIMSTITIAEFVKQMHDTKISLKQLQSEISKAWNDVKDAKKTLHKKATNEPSELSPWQRFISENIAKVKADYPDMIHVERMRKLSEMWKATKHVKC